MTTLSIQPPFPLITDIDGQPLEDGYIWIGTANLPPIGNPIAVYWDAALTIPAALPVRTRGGYPVNAGTPARLYVGSDYSILVQNKNGSTLYSAPVATERYGGGIINAADVVYDPAGTGAVATTVQAKLRDTVSIFDYIPLAEHAAIQAGTSTYDCTAAIAQAIANNSAVVGQPYGYEKVIVFPEGWYNVQHIDLTNRRNVWLWAEGYVLIKGIDSSTKNFIFGSTNYNPANPAASTQTANCFLGGPGQWEFFAAPGTNYQYGMRLEHFTVSRFEKVSAGSGYVAVSGATSPNLDGSVVAAYLQYTYSNLFIDCGFSNPAAPPVGNKSYGLFMGNNNVNSNTFIRCNWQAANVTPAPFVDTIGVAMSGSNNVWDQCDLSGLDTAFIGTGRGNQFRNIYSEYVTTFWSGPASGQAVGCTIQGGIIEIVSNGTAFNLQNCENTTIIGGHYKSALSGTRTFIAQTANFGLTVIQPNLAVGAFTNFITGTYNGASTANFPSVLQTNWLSFPPTQVPSTNANTLDDYEEGTFDAEITFGNASVGVTYSYRQCSYTKTGNRVFVSGAISLSNKGSSVGSARIAGLPFTVANSTNSYSAPSLLLQNVTFSDQYSAWANINDTTIELLEATNAGVLTDLTNADFANNSFLVFSLQYRAN